MSNFTRDASSVTRIVNERRRTERSGNVDIVSYKSDEFAIFAVVVPRSIPDEQVSAEVVRQMEAHV